LSFYDDQCCGTGSVATSFRIILVRTGHEFEVVLKTALEILLRKTTLVKDLNNVPYLLIWPDAVRRRDHGHDETVRKEPHQHTGGEVSSAETINSTLCNERILSLIISILVHFCLSPTPYPTHSYKIPKESKWLCN
jgi:hypothetical protein